MATDKAASLRHFSVEPMSMSIRTPTFMGAKGRPWGKDCLPGTPDVGAGIRVHRVSLPE